MTTSTDWSKDIDPTPWIHPKDAEVYGEEDARHSNCAKVGECKLKPRPQYAQEPWRYMNKPLLGFMQDCEMYGPAIKATPAYLVDLWIKHLQQKLVNPQGSKYSNKEIHEALEVLEYMKAHNFEPPVPTLPKKHGGITVTLNNSYSSNVKTFATYYSFKTS